MSSPNARRAKTYMPPERGIIAPSSEYAVAPRSAFTAPKIHTPMNKAVLGSTFATLPGVPRMPPPIVAPTTIASPKAVPRTRRSPRGLLGVKGDCRTGGRSDAQKPRERWLDCPEHDHAVASWRHRVSGRQVWNVSAEKLTISTPGGQLTRPVAVTRSTPAAVPRSRRGSSPGRRRACRACRSWPSSWKGCRSGAGNRCRPGCG